MVIAPLMSKACWLPSVSFVFGLCAVYLSACGSSDDRPSSLVTRGESGQGGGFVGHGGNHFADAGQANGNAGTEDPGGETAGAAGEATSTAAPVALFPQQLQVDVGCGAQREPSALVLRNGGLLPLVISSATATAGYSVMTKLPLEIAAMASATLQVTPPAAKANALVGDMISGSLTFLTNEAEGASHEVALNTTLFGGQLELTDGQGKPLNTALTLTYLSSDACPDDVRYRVRNIGNLAITLLGPTFPAHLGGTSTGVDGQNVAPGEFVELQVSGNSTNDGACSASGELTFTTRGSVCGSVPKLSVSWPTNTQTANCKCGVSSE